MKLERMKINNFRQYFGEQKIEFAKDKGKKVTVIHGVNGAGKTSLLLAIKWCLYGRTYETTDTKIDVIANVGQLISKEAFHRASKNDPVEASIELTFLHKGDKYLARRTLLVEKSGEEMSKLKDTGSEEFTMMNLGRDGKAKIVHNPIGLMNSILPVNVREYFLFDGEKIDDFAKPQSSSEVKEAIYLVLKLEILDRAKRHLNNAASIYRKNLKKISKGELAELIDGDEDAREDLKNCENNIDKYTQSIKSARLKINDIDVQLRHSHEAKGLQTEREGYQERLNDDRKNLEITMEKIQASATKAYVSIASPVIVRAAEMLDEKRERGEIPSNIRQTFIDDLLNRKICICKRPIGKDSKEEEELRKLLEKSIPGSLEDDVLDTITSLRTLVVGEEKDRHALNELMIKKTSLEDSIDELSALLDDIARQLKDFPLEDISNLEQKRSDYQADVESYSIKKGEQVEKKKKTEENIKELEKRIKEAQKGEKKQVMLGKKGELAQDSADAIDDIYESFANSMREKIQQKTEEIFKELIWKDSQFPSMKLSADFNLEVMDRYGEPARPELSAGERQVLSLSFITAMSRISQEEAPLVMDTPFGRISSQVRNNITSYLPKQLDQLVLFVTDEELRDQALENLNIYIGAEYKLNFDSETGCTKIIEVS